MIGREQTTSTALAHKGREALEVASHAKEQVQTCEAQAKTLLK